MGVGGGIHFKGQCPGVNSHTSLWTASAGLCSLTSDSTPSPSHSRPLPVLSGHSPLCLGCVLCLGAFSISVFPLDSVYPSITVWCPSSGNLALASQAGLGTPPPRSASTIDCWYLLWHCVVTVNFPVSPKGLWFLRLVTVYFISEPQELEPVDDIQKDSKRLD